MKVVRPVIINKNHFPIRTGALQQGVNNIALIIVRQFMQQEETEDDIMNPTARLGRISDTNLGVRELPKLAAAIRDLEGGNIDDVQPAVCAD